MKDFRIILLSCLLLSSSCSGIRRTAGHDRWQNIAFDVDLLDEDGLRGPADGKVAVSYEFSIPNTERCRTLVQVIDQTVLFMPGSPGRIGAGQDDCLCIGSTHQENYRSVLRTLVTLPFVERIIECHFE